MAQLDALSDFRLGGREFNPRRGQQLSFVEKTKSADNKMIIVLLFFLRNRLKFSVFPFWEVISLKCQNTCFWKKYKCVQKFLPRMLSVNSYHAMGRIQQTTNNIFLIFPRKWDLTLHANCLLGIQFTCVRSCFLGKRRKIFQNVVC